MKIFEWISSYFSGNDRHGGDQKQDIECLVMLLEQNIKDKSLVSQFVKDYNNGKHPDEGLRFRLAESLSMAVYPRYKFSEFGRVYLEDNNFIRYYEQIMDQDNWHSLDRKYTLNQFLKLVMDKPGDFAECGVYKGGSALLMCMASKESEKQIHLFDSFEGLSEPGMADGDYWARGALETSMGSLEKTLAAYQHYHIYQGWIPDRFEEISGQKFCFLHVDVDLYKPTYDTLDFFYKRIVTGGVILMDDYGFKTCPGAKQSADEFFQDKQEEIIMLPTGQSFIIKL